MTDYEATYGVKFVDEAYGFDMLSNLNKGDLFFLQLDEGGYEYDGYDDTTETYHYIRLSDNRFLFESFDKRVSFLKHRKQLKNLRSGNK